MFTEWLIPFGTNFTLSGDHYMLWLIGARGFFKEYLNNRQVMRERPFGSPCMSWSYRMWDLLRKYLSEHEVIREGGAILKYHFRVRREFDPRTGKHPSLPALSLLLLCCSFFSDVCVGNTQTEAITTRRAEHSEPSPPLTK
jgi:hypothetical protein